MHHVQRAGPAFLVIEKAHLSVRVEAQISENDFHNPHTGTWGGSLRGKKKVGKCPGNMCDSYGTTVKGGAIE